MEESFSKEEGQEKEKILQFPQLLKKKENKILTMKSKILALSKNEEFKNLLKKKKVTNKYVTIFFGQLVNKNNKRFNISFVTKKKLGNAVKRNKIKRILRQIFNDGIKQNLIKLEKSVLVIAHAAMLNNEYKIIKETLFKDFKKIK